MTVNKMLATWRDLRNQGHEVEFGYTYGDDEGSEDTSFVTCTICKFGYGIQGIAYKECEGMSTDPLQAFINAYEAFLVMPPEPVDQDKEAERLTGELELAP